MTSTSSAHLTCLCGSISEPGTILSDAQIPISIEICHCNPCRQSTGSLGAAFPALKSSPSKGTLSKLTAYHSSQNIARYFCSTCGCHCFDYNSKSKNWYCLSGIIEPSSASKSDGTSWPMDIVKVLRHDYVLDTLDGGLAPILLNLDGRSNPTWAAAAKEDGAFDLPLADVLSLPTKLSSSIPEPKEDALLPAKCHCGGVSLLIKRADYGSNSNSDSGDLARHVSEDLTKYRTVMCACRSCRLSMGVSLIPWALVPPASVLNANAPPSSTDRELPVEVGLSVSGSDENPGLSLKHYWSSRDACWTFCSTCGASVWYWNRQRLEELDIAVGIMRAEEGSMARRWLNWEWGELGFEEECVDGEMGEAWKKGVDVMK